MKEKLAFSALLLAADAARSKAVESNYGIHGVDPKASYSAPEKLVAKASLTEIN